MIPVFCADMLNPKSVPIEILQNTGSDGAANSRFNER